MTDARIPLEKFVHLLPLPKMLDNELQALYLLHPELNTERQLVMPLHADPFLYIKRTFRTGRFSEAFVLLNPELADTLRLLTISERVPTERGLSSIGAIRYEELVYDLSQEVAVPALRELGIRGPFARPATITEASVTALALPHQQIIYLPVPTQLQLTDDRGQAWYVKLTGEVVNPPDAVRS